MKIENVTIGADPELFLSKNGKIISAEGLIGGTKENPKQIDEKGFYIQEDNVMIEFNIPPARNKDEFRGNISHALEYLDMYSKLMGCGLDFSASAFLDKKYLKSEQAKRFGCEPDKNVYTKSDNLMEAYEGTLRCCGGHIHIGYKNPSIKVTEKIVLALDVTLGLDSIILDKDKDRRKLYGKAGSFRLTPYGLEYRTLSNFWIENHNSIDWVYDRVQKALELVRTGEIDYIIKNYSRSVKEIIDSNNVDEAVQLSVEIGELIGIKTE